MKIGSLETIFALWLFQPARAFIGPTFLVNHVGKSLTGVSFSPTDYAHTVDAMSHTLKETHENLKQLELLIARLVEMENHDPRLQTATAAGEKRIPQAVAAAKAAMDCHGVTSPQAKQAFRLLDDIVTNRSNQETASLGDTTLQYQESAVKSHHDYKKILDRDLLEETMEAVERILAFEHLLRVAVIDRKGETHPPHDSTPGMPWAPKVSP